MRQSSPISRGVCACLVLFLIVGSASIAGAHAVLVESSPKDEQVVEGSPEKITLKFDLVANELRQWVVVDPQGYETAVSLYNLSLQRQTDPKNFVIDHQRTL